jgi:HK97 family phage major capsid protein
MPVINSALIPTTVTSELFASAEEASVVLRLARRQPMPTGTVTIPVIQTLPVAGWVNGVGGRKPVTNIEWTSKVITVEEVAALVAVPQAYIDDSGVPIWAQVRQHLGGAIAYAIDTAILFGINAPATFVAGGIVQGAPVSTYAAAGAQPDVPAAVNSAMGAVEATGVPVTGHAADVAMKSKLRGLRDTTGAPLFAPSLAVGAYDTIYGLPVAWSFGAFDLTKAELITGNWDMLVVGVRQDMRFDVSDTAVITDSSGANVLINAFQDDQVIMRVHMRLGYVVGKPINRKGVATVPFAVVKSA